MNKEEIIALAKEFHNLYESLAPKFGYSTRDDTKQFNPDSPNGQLMIEVVGTIAKAIQDNQREEICSTIKAEDDHCADGDYMMDSDDCIKVIRGTWKRPNWNPS